MIMVAAFDSLKVVSTKLLDELCEEFKKGAEKLKRTRCVGCSKLIGTDGASWNSSRTISNPEGMLWHMGCFRDYLSENPSRFEGNLIVMNSIFEMNGLEPVEYE